MKSKRFLRSSDKGTTLIEFLVASTIGIAIMGLSMSVFLANKRLVKKDLDRTSVQQSLRSALDIVGINVRLAGENFSSSFPAIEIIDGGEGNDQLIIRRNLLDEVLKVCTAISNGTNDPLYFGVPGVTPGCAYSDQAQNFSSWSAHRTSEGGSALAYVYDPTTDLGEFFIFDGEVDTSTSYYLQLDGAETWENDYAVGQAAAYIVEDWRFARSGELLQLFFDGDDASPSNIIYGIEGFEVKATLQDNTVLDQFTKADDWTQLKSITVTLTAEQGALGVTTDRSVQANFFPRNVLSN